MPRMPVDEAPAGPAMDAAVAKALGHCPHDLEKTIHWSEDGCGEVCHKCKHCHEEFWGLAYREGYHILPYSTDITAAMGLECEMSHFSLHRLSPQLWQCQSASCGIMMDHSVLRCDCKFADGDTPALTISRAFLEANGVVFIEVPR